MSDAENRRYEEYDDLKKEIENFQKEKERVRAIVGQIGGMPTFSTKLINVIFIIFVIACFGVSMIVEGRLSILMIDIGLAALSIKLILLMHYLSRVNHFQLWVLTSMEWRLNELIKNVRTK